jgi:hypothetical protein
MGRLARIGAVCLGLAAVTLAVMRFVVFDLTAPLIFPPPRPCADLRRFPTRSGEFLNECVSWRWKRRNYAMADG